MSIPAEEGFERSRRLRADRQRHLFTICDNVDLRFKPVCRLCDFWLLYQRDVNFRAYVFFKSAADIEVYKASGLVDEIESFVYSELERYGRGKKSEITVAFEYDSDERVQRDYGGDYFARIR